MRYNLGSQYEASKAGKRLDFLLSKGAMVIIEEVKEARSSSQNRYLHAILNVFRLEYGMMMDEVFTIDEVKTFAKRKCGLVYEKCGEKFLEHTSELDEKQMSDFIDMFRNFSSTLGIYLPSSEEYFKSSDVDNYLENNKKWCL